MNMPLRQGSKDCRVPGKKLVESAWVLALQMDGVDVKLPGLGGLAGRLQRDEAMPSVYVHTPPTNMCLLMFDFANTQNSCWPMRIYPEKYPSNNARRGTNEAKSQRHWVCVCVYLGGSLFEGSSGSQKGKHLLLFRGGGGVAPLFQEQLGF